ncbi:MAG: GNAT family N-acetyltransferase [Rhodobacteraceae bacterium]|nr:GNAT family N-acetyltransferase [Paracoccaceae bacterium]
MSALTIRKATTGDHAAIWDILRPVFRAGDTYAIEPEISGDEALAYWTQSHCFVAEVGGEIVGTYYLRPNQRGGGAHVCNCGYATASAAPGMGVASAMLAHSQDTARVLGFRAMQFNLVLVTNEGAIRLWKRAGFVEAGRLPGVFLHPEQGYVDALILHKSLLEA